MSLSSRGLDAAKTIDDFVGVPLARWLPRRPRPLPERPSDVLVVRLWGLGNLALFAPLASSFTGRRLRLLTLERNVPFVASQLPGVEPLTVPAPYSPRFVPAVLRLARRLRREPPEVVVDLEQFLRLPLVLLRGSCAAPVVGLATPGQQREPLLDRAVRYDPTRHVSLTFAALWHAAGLSGTPRPGTLDARPSLCDGLGLPRGRPLVVIHPGSGDHFPGRRWSPERYGRLGARLARRTGAVVVVTGTPGERAFQEAFAAWKQ